MKTPIKPRAQAVRHMGHTVTAFYDLAQPGWREVKSVPSSVFRRRTVRFGPDGKSVPASVSPFRIAENGFPNLNAASAGSVPQNKQQQTRTAYGKNWIRWSRPDGREHGATSERGWLSGGRSLRCIPRSGPVARTGVWMRSLLDARTGDGVVGCRLHGGHRRHRDAENLRGQKGQPVEKRGRESLHQLRDHHAQSSR